MHVRRLTLRGFMSHADTALAFPDRGLVVVSGHNGSGKSSLIEAVAYGVFGKTLRGAHPWPAGDGAGVVRVETERAHVARARKGAKVGLRWSAPPAAPDVYETTTKAQRALERIVGEFDVWRRTAVFSAADEAHFTTATDAERKRLLESLLGLDAFDAALDACRAELRQAERAAAEATTVVATLGARLEGERGRLADAEAALAEQAVSPDALAASHAASANAEVDLKVQRLAAAAAQRTWQEHALAERALRQELESAQYGLSLLRADCPTCNQALPPEQERAVRAGYERTIAEKTAALTTAAATTMLRRAEADREQAGLEHARQRAAQLHAEHVVLQARHTRAAAAAQTRDRIASTVAQLQAELERVRRAGEAATTNAAELEVVADVLGVRGVRTQVLGTALPGLEAAANAWLVRIAPVAGWRLHLRPYVERKSGAVADAIGLEVEGPGGGSYRGASTGERRRVDVALLLGLVETAASAAGRPAGTLFFDEVFDSLDEAGVEAVSGALEELAAERAVVVVSHNPAVLAHLPTVVRWQVAGGRVAQF